MMSSGAERPRPALTLACGALGRFDRERVLAMARTQGAQVEVVHEDERSILALDRPPIRWEGRRQRGLTWSERIEGLDGRQLSSWRDAAAAGGGGGLVVDGRKRYLHSGLSDIAPLYYLEAGDAVYFAVRIDALAMTSTERLSVDWEAWAAILTLDYPVGDLTPFSEVRRLPPFSTLTLRRGRARVSEERWPWVEVEPRRDVAEGADEVLERMRAAVARLPAGPIVCQLSGGWDSRLCLGLLVEHRRADLTAVTVDHDGGTDRELRVAAQVAELLGVPHQSVAGREEDYWPQMHERSRLADYQLVRQPWRIPMLDVMRGGRSVIDGFPFDAFGVVGEKFFTRETIRAGGEGAAARGLWRRLKVLQARRGPAALDPALARALWASARRQFIAESGRFQGHPARAMLTFYRTRVTRGIALSTYCGLGSEVPMAMPLVDDAVARSALSITSESKYGGHLYRALFDGIDPRLNEIPATSFGPPPPGDKLPRRSQAAIVADGYHDCLRDGPLAPYVRPKIERVLTRHRRGRFARVPLAVLGPAVFHLWHQRYRERLREPDPSELLE